MDTRLVSIGIILLVVGIAIGYGVSAVAPIATRTVTTTVPGPTKTVTSTYTTAQSTTITKTMEEKYTIKLAYNPRVGLYLTDENGMTLYFFAKDYDGQSHCSGECAAKWPVFYVEDINPSPGLNKSDFGVITRPDGKKQITYKGWPLYYFFMDKKPGDINGEGKKGVWFVAKPDYTVMIAVKEGIGMYLVTPEGMTLYYFAKDNYSMSNCYGQCAVKWPPYGDNKLVIPSTLNITDFNFILRDDGKIQLVYKGHPLYLWINDHKRGDTTGQGVKNVWYVAYVSGIIPSD